jgi:hypothetical protein
MRMSVRARGWPVWLLCWLLAPFCAPSSQHCSTNTPSSSPPSSSLRFAAEVLWVWCACAGVRSFLRAGIEVRAKPTPAPRSSGYEGRSSGYEGRGSGGRGRGRGRGDGYAGSSGPRTGACTTELLSPPVCWGWLQCVGQLVSSPACVAWASGGPWWPWWLWSCTCRRCPSLRRGAPPLLCLLHPFVQVAGAGATLAQRVAPQQGPLPAPQPRPVVPPLLLLLLLPPRPLPLQPHEPLVRATPRPVWAAP